MRRLFVDFVALGGAIIGSLLVAANIGLAWYGYIAYFASSIASVYLLKTHNGPKSLLWQNYYFMAINAFGLFRHMN